MTSADTTEPRANGGKSGQAGSVPRARCSTVKVNSAQSGAPYGSIKSGSMYLWINTDGALTRPQENEHILTFAMTPHVGGQKNDDVNTAQ